MFKAKLKAASVHCGITACIAALTASLVYFVWYPGAFASMMRGTPLYLIILAVELCLGPLMSLVIYNPHKSRRELFVDYSIVGVVQVAALIYGLYSVALSRPVYLVFVKDRIEVVAATELNQDDVMQAKDAAYTRLPWFGARSICVESPTDAHEKSELLFSGAAGKDIHVLPKYYRECHDGEVVQKALSKQALFEKTNIKDDQLPRELQSVDFKWLPVSSHFGWGMVAYKNKLIDSAVYLNLDPYK